MPHPSDFDTLVVVSTPWQFDDAQDDYEAVYESVAAAAGELGDQAMVDGTGRGDGTFDVFLYTNDPDRLVARIAELDLPPRTTAFVETTDQNTSTRREHTVQLAGRRKGRASAVKTTVLRERLGDWFAVPMLDGGYTIGRITHMAKESMIAYFYGPIRSDLPSLEELSTWTADQALTPLRCCRNDFLPGRPWRIIGATDFNQDDWPLPELEFQFLHGRHYIQTLNPKTLVMLTRTLLPDDQHWQRPPEDVMFHEDLQKHLAFAIANPDRKHVLVKIQR